MGIDIKLILDEYKRLETTKKPNTISDKYVQMPEGNPSALLIRLLPAADGSSLPFFATRIHKINNRNYHCPCEFINGKYFGNCPICHVVKGLYNKMNGLSKEEAEPFREEASKLKATQKFYWNAVVREMKDAEGKTLYNSGPRIFSCGKQLQSRMLRLWGGDSSTGLEPLGDVTDLETGYDLRLVKRITQGYGNFSYPSYLESDFVKKPSKAGKADEVERWMESLWDLKAERVVKPFGELELQVKIYKGEVTDPELAFPGETIQQQPKQEEVVNSKPAPLTMSEDDSEGEEWLTKIKNL